MSVVTSLLNSRPDTLEARFLSILPRIERHGRAYFRHVKCPHQREEMLAEMRGLCWIWFVRLTCRGKRVMDYVGALASFAARAAGSGRRVCHSERTKDVHSSLARRSHGFRVDRLPGHFAWHSAALEEALRDNTVSPILDQVAFRLDFPAWIQTRTERDRRLLHDLMLGERTKALSQRFGLSEGRISQLRREFMEDWQRFTADRGDTRARVSGSR